MNAVPRLLKQKIPIIQLMRDFRTKNYKVRKKYRVQVKDLKPYASKTSSNKKNS